MAGKTQGACGCGCLGSTKKGPKPQKGEAKRPKK